MVRHLSIDAFNLIVERLLSQARPIEQVRLRYFFKKGSASDVIESLISFQNKDGGFGHGLEPDFQLPDSSPMATSIGFRILDELPDCPEKQVVVQRTGDYLMHSYIPTRQGWVAVPEIVNHYPHAPWWSVDSSTHFSFIDKSWGNPSAEILAYLLKYQIWLTPDILKILPICLEKAITNLMNKDEFTSENEIYCYLKLFLQLDTHLQSLIRPQIQKAIGQLLEKDRTRWNEYLPQPIDFLPYPTSETFGISQNLINMNLDFIVDQLTTHGFLRPTWNYAYPENMKNVPKEWEGQLTLKALSVLKNYNRIIYFNSDPQ